MEDETKARILIIEDDPGFRDLLRLHLSASGYKVRVAEDGVAGGRAILADPPDLIISDIDMPFLDGLELLSLLKTEESTGSIPVILLSGRGDSDTLVKAVDAGAADYLIKPVTRDRLLESVEACLARARGGNASTDQGSASPGKEPA